MVSLLLIPKLLVEKLAGIHSSRGGAVSVNVIVLWCAMGLRLCGLGVATAVGMVWAIPAIAVAARSAPSAFNSKFASSTNGAPIVIAQQLPRPLDDLDDFDYWLGLCNLQAQAADFEEARTSCEQAIALEPKESEAWSVHSEVLRELEQYPEAIASARKAQDLDPESSFALAQECFAFAALKQNEPALDACDRALALDGNWVKISPALAWYRRGVILAQMERLEVAVAAFDHALLLEADDSESLASRCEVLIQLEDYTQAIETCAQAVDGNGRWGDTSPAETWFYQGVARSRLEQFPAAVSAFDRSIRLDNSQPAAWQEQGIVLARMKRYREALTSFEQAAQLQPESSSIQLHLCATLNRLAEYGAALAACQQAQAGDGNWQVEELARFWSEFGRSLEGNEQYEEALAAVNRAVGIAPDSITAWNNRAAVLWRLQDYDESLRSTDRALELDEENAQAWFNRAVALQSQGNFGPALGAYNHAQKWDPEDANIRANRSAVLWQLRNYEGARDTALKAIELDGQSVVAWFNLGMAQAFLNDYDSALASFDRVQLLAPDNVDGLAGRGFVLARLNRNEEAMEILETVLQTNPEHPLALSVSQF
ncbi:MAG: tetratricopeptide repeat protein [Synechococcus sp.]